MLKLKIYKPLFQQYKIDALLSEHRYSVLKLRPYHPNLNSIELICSFLENCILKRNTTYLLQIITTFHVNLLIYVVGSKYFMNSSFSLFEKFKKKKTNDFLLFIGRLWVACAIFCRRKDNGQYYTPRLDLNDLGVDPYFPDGTWCHSDGKHSYYCQNHHCLPEVS